MRYVLINKLTNNLVEKIIFQEGGFKPLQEMFPNYLELIVDKDDVVTNHNMRYDETLKSFVPKPCFSCLLCKFLWIITYIIERIYI